MGISAVVWQADGESKRSLRRVRRRIIGNVWRDCCGRLWVNKCVVDVDRRRLACSWLDRRGVSVQLVESKHGRSYHCHCWRGTVWVSMALQERIPPLKREPPRPDYSWLVECNSAVAFDHPDTLSNEVMNIDIHSLRNGLAHTDHNGWLSKERVKIYRQISWKSKLGNKQSQSNQS